MEYADTTIMKFGKYKGCQMSEVPDEYLLYLYENCNLFGGLKKYIEDNLDAIKSNIKVKD